MDLAELSGAVYSDRYLVTVPRNDKGRRRLIEWRKLYRWEKKAGFAASLYVNSEQERVLVFQGTDDLWDALLSDLPIVAGIFPSQALDASTLAQQSASMTVQETWLTGHSLGGALAILAGARSNQRVVTFNAPGVMGACLHSMALLPPALKNFFSAVARCIQNPRVLNIGIAGDLVFHFRMQTSGRQSALRAKDCSILDIRCRHKIDTLIQQLRLKSENYEDIKL